LTAWQRDVTARIGDASDGCTFPGQRVRWFGWPRRSSSSRTMVRRPPGHPANCAGVAQPVLLGGSSSRLASCCRCRRSRSPPLLTSSPSARTRRPRLNRFKVTVSQTRFPALWRDTGVTSGLSVSRSVRVTTPATAIQRSATTTSPSPYQTTLRSTQQEPWSVSVGLNLEREDRR